MSNLRQILGLLDVKCLYRYSTIFALAVLIGRPSKRAEIPNLSELLLHFSKKSWITRLFEPYCIYVPYNKRKLMNGALTWRWTNTAKFSGSAAGGRQSWTWFLVVFAKYLRNSSSERSEIFTTNAPRGDETLTFMRFFGTRHRLSLKN